MMVLTAILMICLFPFVTHCLFNDSSSWVAYDASNTNGLPTAGFTGAIFDGKRYIYFVPFYNGNSYDGIVLRYDTTSSFSSSSSWDAYDASNTDGLNTVGYYGGVFDGRFVYFSPFADSLSTYHGRVLRYDTNSSFNSYLSWAAYNASFTNGLETVGFHGAIFDGRFIYFVPYTNHNGTYYAGNVLRYDTNSSFNSSSSWASYNAYVTNSLITAGFYGGVFDGSRFIYNLSNLKKN